MTVRIPEGRFDESGTILETERLVLRRMVLDDDAFVRRLLNEPSFIRYIGDRGVRTLDDARRYIVDGPLTSYERVGFGLYVVETRTDQTPVGICGLLKRDTLEHPDLGFAFLPRFWSKGYAYEAASAVIQYGRAALGIERILAITSPDNAASIKLLQRLGFSYEGMRRLTDGAPEVKVFANEAT
ncbi:MAG TPA: GNAT family N-acetyltransferase [Vicinamibacterales bacterium]|nr:GNAT family N-acetyltransferase [Vicinamibacterales bacterium]